MIFQLGKSLCFVQKGSLLCSEESVFCIKGVPFMSPKVSVLKKRGHFFSQKVSGKGSLLILENDHTSSLLQMSGGTGDYNKEYREGFPRRNLLTAGVISHLTLRVR